jgi:quercetin dioxygenase-like cupin family protein
VNREHAIELRHNFAVFQAIGENTKCQCLGLRHCLIARCAVRENPWEVENFSDPAAIILALDLYREVTHAPIIVRRTIENLVRVSGANAMQAPEVILKRFESPDETRIFDKGKFEIIHLAGMTIGRATYEPGWKWSEHVGPTLQASRCTIEHVGLVLSGRATAAFDDGTVVELKAGELFYIPPIPHDSWVIGTVPYISLHFLGANQYAVR